MVQLDSIWLGFCFYASGPPRFLLSSPHNQVGGKLGGVGRTNDLLSLTGASQEQASYGGSQVVAGLEVSVSGLPPTPMLRWPSHFTALGVGFPIYKMSIGRMNSAISLIGRPPRGTTQRSGTVAQQRRSEFLLGTPGQHPAVSTSSAQGHGRSWCGCQCCNQMPLPSHLVWLSRSSGWGQQGVTACSSHTASPGLSWPPPAQSLRPLCISPAGQPPCLYLLGAGITPDSSMCPVQGLEKRCSQRFTCE